MIFKNSLSASWPVRELSSPRLDWPRVGLSASCPVSVHAITTRRHYTTWVSRRNRDCCMLLNSLRPCAQTLQHRWRCVHLLHCSETRPATAMQCIAYSLLFHVSIRRASGRTTDSSRSWCGHVLRLPAAATAAHVAAARRRLPSSQMGQLGTCWLQENSHQWRIQPFKGISECPWTRIVFGLFGAVWKLLKASNTNFRAEIKW